MDVARSGILATDTETAIKEAATALQLEEVEPNNEFYLNTAYNGDREPNGSESFPFTSYSQFLQAMTRRGISSNIKLVLMTGSNLGGTDPVIIHNFVNLHIEAASTPSISTVNVTNVLLTGSNNKIALVGLNILGTLSSESVGGDMVFENCSIHGNINLLPTGEGATRHFFHCEIANNVVVSGTRRLEIGFHQCRAIPRPGGEIPKIITDNPNLVTYILGCQTFDVVFRRGLMAYTDQSNFYDFRTDDTYEGILIAMAGNTFSRIEGQKSPIYIGTNTKHFLSKAFLDGIDKQGSTIGGTPLYPSTPDGGVTDHAFLTSLGFAASGHIGFQAALPNIESVNRLGGTTEPTWNNQPWPGGGGPGPGGVEEAPDNGWVYGRINKSWLAMFADAGVIWRILDQYREPIHYMAQYLGFNDPPEVVPTAFDFIETTEFYNPTPMANKNLIAVDVTQYSQLAILASDRNVFFDGNYIPPLPLISPQNLKDIAVHPDGIIYVADAAPMPDNLYYYDIHSGASMWNTVNRPGTYDTPPNNDALTFGVHMVHYSPIRRIIIAAGDNAYLITKHDVDNYWERKQVFQVANRQGTFFKIVEGVQGPARQYLCYLFSREGHVISTSDFSIFSYRLTLPFEPRDACQSVTSENFLVVGERNNVCYMGRQTMMVGEFAITELPMKSVAGISASNTGLAIACRTGEIWHSTDDGVTWRQKESPNNVPLNMMVSVFMRGWDFSYFAFLALGDDRGLAQDRKGNILYSMLEQASMFGNPRYIKSDRAIVAKGV